MSSWPLSEWQVGLIPTALQKRLQLFSADLAAPRVELAKAALRAMSAQLKRAVAKHERGIPVDWALTLLNQES